MVKRRSFKKQEKEKEKEEEGVVPSNCECLLRKKGKWWERELAHRRLVEIKQHQPHVKIQQAQMVTLIIHNKKEIAEAQRQWGAMQQCDVCGVVALVGVVTDVVTDVVTLA
jgi:hypothetical protein